MEYKVCSKCNRTLSVDKFYKKGKNSDEYRSYCKECGNNWQLKYYNENREDRVRYQKIYETNKRNKKKKYEIKQEERQELFEQSKKYLEGKKVFKTMISHKPVRNKKLPNDYRENFKNLHDGKLYCEICGEWEEIPEILEVHHKLELSKYDNEEKEYSTFEDVIMLCPNCHKLIHLKGDIEEVKKIINKLQH